MTNSVEKGSKPKEENNGYLSYLYEKYVVALYEKMLQKINSLIVEQRAKNNFDSLEKNIGFIPTYKTTPEIKDFFDTIEIVERVLSYIEYRLHTRSITEEELKHILGRVFMGTPFTVSIDLRNSHDRAKSHSDVTSYHIPLKVYHFGNSRYSRVVAQLVKIENAEEYGSDFELRDLLN